MLLDEVDQWYLDLAENDPDAVNAVTAAIDRLEEHGPSLGRPTADHIKGSRHNNMKELRPPSSSVRILFIFDPQRNAVLLVAGDKAGDWKGWYNTNIPIADSRYDQWISDQNKKINQDKR